MELKFYLFKTDYVSFIHSVIIYIYVKNRNAVPKISIAHPPNPIISFLVSISGVSSSLSAMVNRTAYNSDKKKNIIACPIFEKKFI